MNSSLLNFLCDPETGAALTLSDSVIDEKGQIQEGKLTSARGTEYTVRNGIPRFVESEELQSSVESFGDEWNRFNFVDHKKNWLGHTVKNTFGSTKIFKDKIIIDAGGGSGSQTLWMLEAGAKHVILLELSHSVDDVIQRNLEGIDPSRYDVVQCSIDAPPIREGAIPDMVYCHNVIQHTPSVEKTAHALFKIVGEGGEFIFNCYPRNDKGLFRWVRFNLVYSPLRWILSRMPAFILLAYCRFMGMLRLIPFFGTVLEKLAFCVRGDIVNATDRKDAMRRGYQATVLNTYDCFGSHSFQHLKTEEELEKLVAELQPDENKVLNKTETLYSRPTPIGIAIRIFK